MTLDLTVTDMFCGAGGSTTGAVQAGADVRLAINHWKRAIETHHQNYPQVAHALADLHVASPRRFPSTTLLVASPECTSHSLAKGRKRTGQGQPALPGLGKRDGPDLEAEAEERSRCTMWTPLDWAEHHQYQAVILENVVDAHLWRPFPAWLQAWKSLDYEVELVYLNSMFAFPHPAPQSRDRLYVVAWKRGNRRPDLSIKPLAFCPHCTVQVASVQSWKHPTHRYGKYRQQYVYRCPQCAHEVTPAYAPAACAIDWSLPAPRIGDRTKPLREKTMQRIAYGLSKFAQTPASADTQAQVSSLLMQLSHSGTDAGRIVSTSTDPFPTQTARDDLAVVLPFLLDHLGEYRPRSLVAPFSTICAAGNHHSLIVPPAWSWLMSYYNHGQLVPVSHPTPTITTLERHALVIGEATSATTHALTVESCGFRMLTTKEIQAAMAFPASYVLTGTRREQVKLLGNAVTPPAMRLLMERVIASLA